jgi:D-glycero-D-manno-heptose 1,7-bisphosphate phosphatase
VTTVFVITNQSGLAKGVLTSKQVHSFIEQINKQCGHVIQDYWACPFQCSDYRKPNPGMILGLADKHFVDLQTSIFVGDSESDRRCADAARIGSFIWAKEYFGWAET